ncbi:MAG: DUF3341 domain-containing protein [Bacteroidetes bacterium]|nr:MAG: DUF3341 domain-containing protein [Bacteroidota bacterium]REK03464.1 MAG: DUF3341 domain-containing protein [Bacteroidota bacterium]REK34769.1 MAG: DUF3341 domain-containing protein [Bacteroidota bacterium]REK51352.1 MAG: DUF3341 domain-containing protein [Bacteroidota bacterium]
MAKRIYGIFDDEEILMNAIPSLKEKGVVCKDVQSPFPIHGIEKLLNVPRTRISTVAFLFGITGTSLALLMTWYMMIADWPVNIGGKPNFAFYLNIPAFIPVTFEMTVFCAAHGMALTFLLRSKLLPGVTAPMPHPRITDDKFVLHVDVKDESKMNEVVSLIRNSGASDVLMKSMQFA